MVARDKGESLSISQLTSLPIAVRYVYEYKASFNCFNYLGTNASEHRRKESRSALCSTLYNSQLSVLSLFTDAIRWTYRYSRTVSRLSLTSGQPGFFFFNRLTSPFSLIVSQHCEGSWETKPRKFWPRLSQSFTRKQTNLSTFFLCHKVLDTRMFRNALNKPR